MPAITDIDPATVRQRLSEGWKPFILDVRSQAEADEFQIPGTDARVTHTEVASMARELPADRDILVYCRRGGRSAMAANTLSANGVGRLFNLTGGTTGWRT